MYNKNFNKKLQKKFLKIVAIVEIQINPHNCS